MENINNNRLDDKQKLFFNRLKTYIGEPIYFYGSILRPDYTPKKSDIDTCVYTDNVQSTCMKLQSFFKVDCNFKQIVWRFSHNGNLIYGTKMEYDSKNSGPIEISIYNSKDKDSVMKYHRDKIVLPIYVSIMMYILKMLYYHTFFIPKQLYKYMKNKLLTSAIGYPEQEFIIIK